MLWCQNYAVWSHPFFNGIFVKVTLNEIKFFTGTAQLEWLFLCTFNTCTVYAASSAYTFIWLFFFYTLFILIDVFCGYDHASAWEY